MTDELKDKINNLASQVKELANEFEPYSDSYNTLILASNILEKVSVIDSVEK